MMNNIGRNEDVDCRLNRVHDATAANESDMSDENCTPVCPHNTTMITATMTMIISVIIITMKQSHDMRTEAIILRIMNNHF